VRYIFFMVCLLSFSSVTGQKKRVLNKVAVDLQKENSQWYDGTAILKDDEQTRLQGLFQFNEKTQVLAFKSGNESEVLSPNKVMKFDFFDEEIEEYRTFISIDYPIVEDFKKEGKFLYYSLNETSNLKTIPLFFEIIRETKKFVILVNVSPIHLIQGTKNTMIDPITGRPTNDPLKQKKTRLNELAQEVSVFFLDTRGKLFLFDRGTFIETKDSTKKAKPEVKKGFSRFNSIEFDINSDVDLGNTFLSRMMGDYFGRVKEYMDVNKLRGNRDEDLIKIIDYYKHLEDTEGN
jgi:hypothetical protein